MDREFVIWVFVGYDPVGFYWFLCSGGFLLVVFRWWVFVGYGGQICGFGRARWRHRRFGRGLWVSPSMWPWAMDRGCGVGFFLLGLLGSDGGSVFGYNGGSVVGCACVVGCRLICGARLAMLWVAVW